MSHPPFNHNPHVYNMVDPAKRVTVEHGVSPDGDPTDSLVVHSDVARPADEEAAELTPDVAEPDTDPADGDGQSDEDADVDVNGDGRVDGYEVFTKADLVAECERRGLATTGNKPDLVRRLQDADSAKVPERHSAGG